MTGAHTPSVADVLDAAADRLTSEGAWTQGVAYRDENGNPCPVKRAKCMCVLGALWLCGDSTDGPATKHLSRVLGEWPPDWNDAPGRTQTEVIAKLREAANAARATSKEASHG